MAATATPSSSRAHLPRLIGLFTDTFILVSCSGRAGLFVKVGVQNAHLGDAPYRKLAAARRAANRLRGWSVVNTERLLLVHAHVRMHPRNLVRGVAVDHGQTSLGASVVNGNLQSIRKLSLDYVAWHRLLRVFWPAGYC